MMKKKCRLTGIITNSHGEYCFKTCFKDKKLVQQYKDMLYWIIKNDDILVDVQRGYHDDKVEVKI